MHNHLNPEQENAIIEDALENYPLAPMPHSITTNVMTRIHQNARPALVTWKDFGLSLTIGLCVGALFFAAQSLPPILMAKIRIQQILLYQDFLVYARWVVPMVIFSLVTLLSVLTIYYLQTELRE